MANILVFGDSVAYGAWDPKGGWVRRLREVIEEPIYKTAIYTKHYKLTGDASLVYNLGVTMRLLLVC
ncbi:MAG: hypothetical protein PHQ59_00920 [Candidatus Daviesbacteria bacterium]|nr:hypothetical protein [Candidatus Daviesbacteria bacterium]